MWRVCLLLLALLVLLVLLGRERTVVAALLRRRGLVGVPLGGGRGVLGAAALRRGRLRRAERAALGVHLVEAAPAVRVGQLGVGPLGLLAELAAEGEFDRALHLTADPLRPLLVERLCFCHTHTQKGFIARERHTGESI